jgi:hypothetical protein
VRGAGRAGIHGGIEAMIRITKRLALAALASFMAGCAGSPPEEGKSVEDLLAEKNLRIVEELNQLVNFNIRGYQYVNRQNVVLQEGVSRNYLVETRAPCPNLEFARTIAFTSTGRVVREYDKLLVRDGPGRVEYCVIKAIYRLEKIEN